MRPGSCLPAVQPLLLLPLLLLLSVPAGAVRSEKTSDVSASSGVRAGSVTEDDLSFVPGLWQVTTLSMFPLVDETIEDIDMQCLSTSPISPEELAGRHESCTIDREAKGNTESWEMHCKDRNGKVEGSGSFTSFGETARGWMKTTMFAGKQALVTDVRWNGHRLGPCDMEPPAKRDKREQRAKKERRERRERQQGLTQEERRERDKDITSEERKLRQSLVPAERLERRQKRRELRANEDESAPTSDGS